MFDTSRSAGVEADDRQRRLGPEPCDDRAGADPRHAVEQPDSRAQPLLGVVDVGGRPLSRPATATLPASSCRLAIRRASAHQGVGHQAAPHAGVDGVVERADLDDAAGQPAQRIVRAGHADVPVAAVGDHDHVGAQLVVVRFEQAGSEAEPDLLLALDEHRHD